MFWWRNLRERSNFEDQGIDEGIILRWIIRKWSGDMYWIDVTQDMDRGQAVVHAVINLQVP